MDSDRAVSDDVRSGADAPACVLVTDSRGDVVWTSPEATRVFDDAREPVAEDEIVRRVLGMVDDGTGSTQRDGPHEVTVTAADGAQYDLAVTATTLADGDGGTVYHCRRTDAMSVPLDRVLSRVTDGVIALDTEWRYTYVNDAAEALLGTPESELLGDVIWERFPSTAGSELQRAFEAAIETNEPVSLEWQWPRTEGWYEIRAFPSETGLSMYVQDITEKKARTEALRDERDLTEQLLQSTPVGIAVHKPDGTFVRLNERAEEILDIDREELVGTPLEEQMWDAMGPDGQPFPDEEFPFNVARRTGEQTMGTEMQLRTAAGERTWVSVSATPVKADDGRVERIVVAFEDISEQKQYQQELEESETLFRAVFEGTLDALILADDDGTYLEVNEAACELFGRDEDELVGHNVAEFAPPGYDVEAAWAAFLEQGTLEGEFPVVQPDGETRMADFAATANVRPGQHISALRDITERKAAERELEAQRNELERLNRINELIRETNQVVAAATDRETIEAAVCGVFAESDSYPVAATCNVAVDGTVDIEHIAGLSVDAFETVCAAGEETVESAIVTAAMEGEAAVVTGLSDPERHSAALRAATTGHDISAIGAIPILYDGLVSGVLTVGATDDEAFSDRELEVFVELGQILGAAIDAVETKRLLHASVFLELDIGVRSATEPLVAMSAHLDGPVSLKSVVPAADGRYLLYVDVGSLDTDTFEGVAADTECVDAVRALADEPRRLFEVRVTDAPVVDALLDAGGRIRGATFEHGTGRFTVDVMLDTDVRAYLDQVKQAGHDVTLLTKREVERATPRTWSVTDGSDGLTERQRTVLEAAYRSGYFDWPRRRTTGEELADSLDIASSTLHQHLRVATGKVLDEYFSLPSSLRE
ncbi:PAS domain S-box protein [Halomicroarcula sp. GCM10025817]|uniref:PAS domain S-box protein n=1 Tax=Haloarcula TaxID=2237 RepID=UPI0023E89BC3|nr:PAS domain S-box protein [Halomicroarcula sp. SYNS111]